MLLPTALNENNLEIFKFDAPLEIDCLRQLNCLAREMFFKHFCLSVIIKLYF